jgi:hypothetical protein
VTRLVLSLLVLALVSSVQPHAQSKPAAPRSGLAPRRQPLVNLNTASVAELESCRASAPTGRIIEQRRTVQGDRG